MEEGIEIEKEMKKMKRVWAIASAAAKRELTVSGFPSISNLKQHTHKHKHIHTCMR